MIVKGADAFHLCQGPFAECSLRSRWKLLPGTEPLPIVPLISPLRYDIVVRLEYLRFLEANIAWFDRDFPSYVEAARKTGYFVWFTEVMCRNFRPRLLHTERKLQRAFEHRLRKTTRMYLRFLKSGFDRRFPVLLNTGDRILKTDTGKHIICRYYAGDGCHRIALLLLAGESVLQAETYYVRCFRHYAPRDNTARLVQTLSLSRKNTSLSYRSTTRINRSMTDSLCWHRSKKRIPQSWKSFVRLLRSIGASEI